MIKQLIRLLAGLVVPTVLVGVASAAEIKVIGSPGTRAPYTLLMPGFEEATGNKVATTWGSVNEITKRVADGEIADVVMLPAAQIDELIKLGKIIPDTRLDVARSGVGVAVRAGAPKIDISSANSIKKALLAAKSIAYSAGPSGIYIAGLNSEMGHRRSAQIQDRRSGAQHADRRSRGAWRRRNRLPTGERIAAG